MSARMLRRFLAEQEQNQGNPSVSQQEEREDSDSPAESTPSGNPFDLLDDQDDEPKEVNVISEQEAVDYSVTVSSDFRSSAGKRRNKKKKKQSKINLPLAKAEPDGDVEFPLDELCISEMMLPSNSSCAWIQSETSRLINKHNNLEIDINKQLTTSILTVDPKYLKAENELRRIFGSKVVSSFENNFNAGGSRQFHGGRRGSCNFRKTVTVAPSNHWPRWDGSLSMEFLETKDGEHFFRYTRSLSYDHAQQTFEAAKAIHDLNGIAGILLHHPYHIESLLTIADVLKFSGEHQSSADAIGKCLYALECAWHPSFNPLQGTCRLRYNHDTNKPIFSVLFHHMQNLNRRGCHRSALEVCKLLLSLDHDDPMGALFCIDYFSLRAEEYSWLEKFVDVYKSDCSLWLFPNFSYSLPICRFFLEHNTNSKEAGDIPDKATSSDLMEQALMLHPLILKKLVAKAPLKDVAWTKILKDSFFSSAQAGSPSLEHLINIYIERHYIMWRLPDLQKLLKDAALRVIESLNDRNNNVKDWACVRQEAFQSDSNEYSHLLISEFSDSVPTLPPDDLRQFMVDPHALHAANNGEHVHAADSGAAPREILNRNPVVVFLESMLPWVTYDQVGEGPEDEQNENGN